MANNDLRSAGAVWGGFLARYLLNLDIGVIRFSRGLCFHAL
jgi:hypothetical protein